MRKSFKVEITAVLIIYSVLLLTSSNTIIFSGSVQGSDEIDDTATRDYSLTLYDSVKLFLEGQTTFSINISFQKNWIYYFSFESYVPFSDVFMMDVFCQTPTSRTYHFFDYTGTIENDISKIFFEYGSTESGYHIINFMVNTSQNINIHIYLEEYMPLDDYYSRFNVIPFNESSLFWDINQYSILHNTMEYTYPVKDDVEYKFNFFRVNPISDTDKIENLYENPDVKMTLTLNETDFDFYRDIPTLDYALYGNVPESEKLEPDRSFGNNTFIERFGAHCTGNLSISISLDGLIPFDLNFAFLVWEVGNIGNGTDGIEEIGNSTIPNPLDNNETELYNKTLADSLDTWLIRAGLLIEKNWWTLVIVVGSFLVLAIINGKYKFLFKSQIKKYHERNGSDVYDIREDITMEVGL